MTEINGHNLEEIVKALSLKTLQPHVIIAHTIKGHGVSFRHALGYVSGLCGSQTFHHAECGLDPSSIMQAFKK